MLPQQKTTTAYGTATLENLDYISQGSEVHKFIYFAPVICVCSRRAANLLQPSLSVQIFKEVYFE